MINAGDHATVVSYLPTTVVTVIVTVLLTWLTIGFYKRYKPRWQASNSNWRLALLNAAYHPTLCMIWLFAILFLLAMLQDTKVFWVTAEHMLAIRVLAVTLILFWFVYRYISGIEQILLSHTNRSRENRTTVRAVGRIVRILSVIAAALVLLQGFGVSISSLIAVGGAGTLVLGFAARDMLANCFGGLMLFWDRPFTEGDWIRSPDREIEGVVEKIGWRLTTVRTFDKRPLYIPNSIFSTISIENPARMYNRRIKTLVGLRYADAPKVEQVLVGVENMLRAHPDIDQKQFMMVRLVEFAPSALNFVVYTFTKTVDWAKFQAVQQDVFLKILQIIADNGAECAFPTRTLHMSQTMTSASPDLTTQPFKPEPGSEAAS